jgi:hypothetical protein
MMLFDCLCGIDRAARDTGRRVRVTVMGENRLDAGIRAERLIDQGLRNPVEYSHAMEVEPRVRPLDVVAALPIAA